MFQRSKEAAIMRAEECKVQVISAFGAKHPLARQAADLADAIKTEAERLKAPKTLLEVFEPAPAAVEPGPA
jgi:hypothetical protein